MKTPDGLNVPANSFEHLANLTELDLSYNLMENLDPKVFSYLPKLERLDLSGNRIYITPNMFVHLKELKNLTLSGNQVSIDVEESLQKIYNLNFR